jgi:hypothetical protein
MWTSSKNHRLLKLSLSVDPMPSVAMRFPLNLLLAL